MRQIVLDTETTGLLTEAGHRIIEIGCVELVDRRLTGRHFHRYLNPDREIEREAQEVHGITQEFLKDKPKFGEIVREFFDFVETAELIAHNAPFDMGFINHEFKLCGFDVSDIAAHCLIVDTLMLARRLHPGQKNTLDALCKRYHIEHFNREWHGALLDAEILAQVYLAMTGGQGSLFAETLQEEAIESPVQIKKRKEKKKSNGPLRVIYASPEELAAHEQLMKEIEKNS